MDLRRSWHSVRSKLPLHDERAPVVTAPYAEYNGDPVRFGREVLGHRYWAAQRSMLREIAKPRARVVVRGGRGTTKTFTFGAAVEYFMQTAPSIVITTAPRDEQVRENMWSKIRAAHIGARRPLLGDLGVQSLDIGPGWRAHGTTTNRPDNVRGAHSGLDSSAFEADLELIETPEQLQERIERETRDHPLTRMFCLLDETLGIAPSIIHVFQGSWMRENVHVAMLSNPLASPDSDHPYVTAHRPGSGWHRIHIAAREFPQDWDDLGSDELFIIPPELREGPGGLAPEQWVQEMRVQHGEESPIYRSDVLGLFSANTTDNQFIPRRLLVQGLTAEHPDDGRPESRHIGVDVAASDSGDWSVAVLFINGVLSAEHQWRTSDTMATAGLVVQLMQDWGDVPARNVHLDDLGVGKGVGDRLRQMGYHVDCVDVGAKAVGDWQKLTGEMLFKNRKAELHWIVRRALEEGLCCIPQKYERVWQQAQWMTFDYALKGGGTEIVCALDKDALREKYGRSPDNWEAAMLAWSRAGSSLPTFKVAGSIAQVYSPRNPLGDRRARIGR